MAAGTGRWAVSDDSAVFLYDKRLDYSISLTGMNEEHDRACHFMLLL
jgi:hypothetical protein